MNEQLWADYMAFHAEQIATDDIDPVYPVLRYIGADTDRESAIWLTFLHVAYYHIGSALAVWHQYPYPAMPADKYLSYPCGTERRAHRTPAKLARHLADLISHAPLAEFVDRAVVSDPFRSWSRMQTLLQSVWGNGRWATYKTSEMLMKVNGLPLKATDMGHRNGSGSRHGLKLLYPNAPTGNTEREINTLDRLSNDLVSRLQANGITATLETAETSLCDFHSLVEGRYYLGHDIDAMLKQLRDVPSPLTEKALKARWRTFPHAYLGELNGWEGPRNERKHQYRDTGQILRCA